MIMLDHRKKKKKTYIFASQNFLKMENKIYRIRKTPFISLVFITVYSNIFKFLKEKFILNIFQYFAILRSRYFL